MKEIIAKRYQGHTNTIATSADNTCTFDDLIDFRIGDPDITTNKIIIDHAYQEALNGYTHYMGSYGDPQLIQSLMDYFQEEYGLTYSKENIMITTSGSHALWLAIQVTIDPGDEVIVTDPCFDSYVKQVEDAQGIPVRLPLSEKDGWVMDPVALEALITPKTKGIILNTPNNPCGVSYSDELLQKIADIAIKHDLLVYADDIYTIFSYAHPFHPIAALPGMKDRTITIRSFSKNFVMTGWRLGCMVAPKDIVKVSGILNGHIVFSAPSISQRAAIEALDKRKEIQPEITKEFQERATCAINRINKIPYLTVLPLDSSIYLWINIQGSKMNSQDFCKWALDTLHIGFIPGTAFGKCGEGYVRLALTCSISKINEAFDRLETATF